MKNIRQRLVNTLYDGVFAAIRLIRQGPVDLLIRAKVENIDGFWTIALTDAHLEDIAFYERLVEDNALWAQFEQEHLHARHRNHAPMSVFEAYPELGAADALDRASCNDMIVRQLRVLAQKFTGEREISSDDGDLHAAFGAWNRAGDRNLDFVLARKRNLLQQALAQFRLLPALWLIPLGVAPFAGDLALNASIGGMIALGVTAMANHLRHHHTRSQMRRHHDAFCGEARDLSSRIRLAATVRYTHLTTLMEKALEMSKQPLARRHERGESREWNIGMARWKAVADHLAARIQALRQVMAIHIGLHEIIYRGAGDWAAYLDRYDNLSDPKTAMESFMPPLPRAFGRGLWWLGLAAVAAVEGVRAAGLEGAPLVLAGVSLAGFVLTTAEGWLRGALLKAPARIDAEFVKARISEAVTAEVRREISEAYENEVGELIRLLAEWTHPDTDPPYRR